LASRMQKLSVGVSSTVQGAVNARRADIPH
jgi:hypothetical protein